MDKTIRFSAIGTSWEIRIGDELSDFFIEEIETAIKERIAVFDKNYSRFRDDSVVTKMALHTGTYQLPADAEQLFGVYKTLYEMSNGLVTPLIGQVLVDAGYDAHYSLVPKEIVPPAKQWETVFNYHHPTLTLFEPALLDFGAIGKGYLVDIVAGIISSFGIEHYSVDAGGDILQRSSTESVLQVGLEHPLNTNQAIGIAEIKNQSLCGSAGNRRVWGKYHHIINPVTTQSPQHIAAVWAVAASTIIADAVTTALFFVEPETVEHYFECEYVIMYSNGSARISPHFPGTLFTK